MECKGRRTMKCCVFFFTVRSPPPPPLSFPLGWYIPDQFAEEELLPTLLQTCGILRWGWSGGGGGGDGGAAPGQTLT